MGERGGSVSVFTDEQAVLEKVTEYRRSVSCEDGAGIQENPVESFQGYLWCAGSQAVHCREPGDIIHCRVGFESSLAARKQGGLESSGHGRTEPLGPWGWILFLMLYISQPAHS